MIEVARQLVRHRSLLWTLTSRELKARYRGSALGYLWSLVNPLLLVAVYSFVFGVVFTPRTGLGQQPYALFLICGLFPWIWFSTSLLEGTMALSGNAGLIRKAAFPAELLPAVSVTSNLAHFLFALPVLAASLAVGRFLGHPVGGWSLLLLPVLMAVQLPLIAGLALALAALHVHFKDIRDLVAHALTLLFFLTPILYSIDAIPIAALRRLVRLNPLTPFLLAYQELLFAGRAPAPLLWLQMALLSIAAWIAGTWLLDRLRDTLVEAV